MSKTGTAVCACLMLAVAPSAVPEQASPRRSLAIEDYYRIQTVDNARISPDGRWVLYEVSTRIEDDNSTRTETWIAGSDGAAVPRRILHYGKDISGGTWTEQNRFQYVSDGSWEIDPGNWSGIPRQVKTPAAGALPSPDGQWVARIKELPKPAARSREISEFERRHEERFKGVTFDWKDFQRDGAAFPAPDPHARPAGSITIQPLAGGPAKVLMEQDLRPTNLAWDPQGRMLLFIADSHWRDELQYERPDLWTVTTEGTVTRLTDDSYTYRDAAFSPDGANISYVRSYGTDMVIRQKLNHGGPTDLFIRPVKGGDPVNLTADWELEPSDPVWSPDSRYLYFTATIGGAVHLFRVAPGGGKVEQMTRGERRLNDVSIDRQFKRIAYTVGRHDSPPEVYTANIDGSDERQLSQVNGNILAEVEFSKADRLLYPSYDGTRIEGWLMFPYAYDPAHKPYPLIVMSHGGPHSATGYSFDFKKQFFAARGYFVLDTNFRSSTGYGEAFKWATWGEWGRKDGEDVVSGVDYVLKHYPIDPKRVGHTGHSYGGFMTNWLITQYPERFAAAITGAGISNWISDYGTADIFRTKETEFFGTPWDPQARERMIQQSPLTYAGRVQTPTLFVHGEVDQRVPYEEAEQMYFALKRRGIPARMIRYEGQPHGIRGHWNNVHRMLNELAWWEKYLKAGAAEAAAHD